MPDNNLTKLNLKNLLQAVRSSVGSTIFRHLYVRNKTTGAESDTMQGGELSCAFYVSGILAIFGLIDHAHATVATTVKQMQQAGWQKIDQHKVGAVAFWPELHGHEHIGFYLGQGKFISNSTTTRTPQIHNATPGGRAQPSAFYWHPALDD